MRVVIDGTVLEQPATGIAKATMGLYEECQRQVSDLQVSFIHRKRLECLPPSGMTHIGCGRWVRKNAWRNLLLPACVRLSRPTAVHFPCNGNVPARLSGVPVVTTYHDVLPLIIPGFFKSDEDERAYRQRVQTDIDRTDLLITDSQYSAQQIATHFRVRTEPQVIYLAPFLKSDGAQSTASRGSYFLYVGGYDRRKGIEALLRVFIGLRREKQVSGRLILTGNKVHVSDELSNLISQGREMGVVEELGYVSDSDLLGLYAGATALVYPSKYEGFGLPPLEAMAIGCPVITAKSTSIPEVCGDAACYVDPDDDADLARGMVALEENPDLREELRAKGRVQARNFSWSRSAQKFMEQFGKVCQRSRRGAVR